MNNEKYNQFIDEAYENYYDKAKNYTTEDLFYNKLSGVGDVIEGMLIAHTRDFRPYSQEEFINKIKTDKEFSEKWGLTIEERELSYKERWFLAYNETFEEWDDKNWKNGDLIIPRCSLDDEWTEQGIPTKLITIIYKETKIETYE